MEGENGEYIYSCPLLPELEDFVENLVKRKNWRLLLEMGQYFDEEDRDRYLKACPSPRCLSELCEVCQKYGIVNILSIGCGLGILEWIINLATGIKTSGVEKWVQKFGAKKYIRMNYAIPEMDSEFLERCVFPKGPTSNNFALLFCYFNDRVAFNQYLDVFRGKYIIIIGPTEESEIQCNVTPMNPGFKMSRNVRWILIYMYTMEDGYNEIVIYKRINKYT